MGKLVEEYEKNLRLYLRKKTNASKKSENERKSRVLSFLRFCEKNSNAKTIKDITNDDYRSFVSSELSNKSIETKRKYLLALSEFFKRAHLNIQVNVANNIARTKEKKIQKILDDLNKINLSQEQQDFLKNVLLKHL